MPGTHILICPAVLRLHYHRQGWDHQVFIAVDIHGNNVVSLDTGDQWSGWHGHWGVWRDGGLVVWMHYTGENRRAWPRFFFHLANRGPIVELYEFDQAGERLTLHARMVTWRNPLPMLDMAPAAQWRNPWDYQRLHWPSPRELPVIAAREQL